MPAGISSRSVVNAFRDARSDSERPVALILSGPLAEQLARELAEGGAREAIQLGGEPSGVDAVLLVLAGQPAPPEIELARAAVRNGVPVVAVQLDSGDDSEIPYVLATDVVPCPRGEGFPVAAIGRVLARRLGNRGAGLAAALPRLREGMTAELTHRAAVSNALVALLPGSRGSHLPLMAMAQLRLALALSVANGRQVGSATAPDAGAVLAAAPALRALSTRAVRHTPLPQRLVQAAVAYAATLAVGKASSLRTPAD
jgi:hypothetical protein